MKKSHALGDDTTEKMTADVKKHLPPDGGYGWVIVAAIAISNVINVPILQGFALLFRNIFIELEMSTTDISMIINVNSSFGFLLGMMNGPLLKTFGYRKVGMFGTVLMFVGILMTSRATSFAEFIIFYGLMNSAGLIITMSAFGLAMNTYFVKRRSRASGVCMTVTGLGPVFMPLVMSKLIDVYGERGTALIMSGLVLHTFCSAMLMHPIKWHYKKISQVEEEERALKKEEGDDKLPNKSDPDEEIDRLQSEYDHIITNSVHNLEPALVPRRVSDASIIGRRNLTRSMSCHLTVRKETRIEPDPLWWSKSSTNISYVPQLISAIEASAAKENGLERKKADDSGGVQPPDIGQTSKPVKWYSKVVNFFDLDLLTDRGYVVIWLGLSIAFTAEINFSLMTPIILGDRGFDIDQTAKIMSVIGISDIVFRFLSPFVGEKINISARYMYMSSIILLIVCRTGLTFTNTYLETIITCAGLGVAKGFRTVYMTLVIPNYVPLDKLASASGLQTVMNGILLMLFGPLLGVIRDLSGSYNMCIHAINTLSAITVTLWILEYIFFIRKTGSQNYKS